MKVRPKVAKHEFTLMQGSKLMMYHADDILFFSVTIRPDFVIGSVRGNPGNPASKLCEQSTKKVKKKVYSSKI